MTMRSTAFTPAANVRIARRCAAAVALSATVLLAACTPLRWERDGLALDYADNDWSDCRRQSIASANRRYFEPFPRLYFGRDLRGRPFTYYSPSSYPGRFMLEQEYLDSCLRAHGFRRVPVQPANAAAQEPASHE